MVARFLLFAIILFVVFLPLWSMVSPFYKKAVARTASAFLQLTFDGDNKSVVYDEYHAEFRVEHRKMRSPERPAFSGESIHYNMVILLAMILASPALGAKRRIRFLLAGAGILFFFHCFHVAVKVEEVFAKDMGPYSTEYYSDFNRHLYESITQFFGAFGQQLLPFAIWVILCAPVILKSRSMQSAESKEDTEASPRKSKDRKQS